MWQAYIREHFHLLSLVVSGWRVHVPLSDISCWSYPEAVMVFFVKKVLSPIR